MLFFVNVLLSRKAKRNGFPFLSTKQEKTHNTNADASIGEVEHGTEEHKLLSAFEREPIGIGGYDEWEVEHVYHFAR
jgi:hypothetical protein